MSVEDKKVVELQAKLREAVLEGESETGVALAAESLSQGLKPLDFFQKVINPVVTEIGEQFARLEIFLPELMRAGMVIKEIQNQVLEPAIKKAGTTSSSMGKVIVGTCQGDIHDIGKNMVALMLQVNGFEVYDLGTNVTPKDFIEAAKREQADIIAMSTLLTPSIPYIQDLVKLLEGYNIRNRFLIIAGGAAVTRQWAEKSGIDGFGEDAIEAVEVCKNLLKTRKVK